VPDATERASPGLAALFALLSDDGRHSILDLGPAQGRHLRLLGRFARQIRVVGMLPGGVRREPWADVAAALAPHDRQPYDVVLAWDVLDRLDPEEHPLLIARLTEITAPRALLFAVVDGSGGTLCTPLAFTLLDVGKVSQSAAGPPMAPRKPLLPAHVERTLAPFEVVQAFALRTGQREYLTRKAGCASFGGCRGRSGGRVRARAVHASVQPVTEVIEHELDCPFCGEPITMLVDLSVDDQQYVEDCEVCCNPILVRVRADEGELVSFEAEQGS
jgi:Cysteine-rich CPXCG